MAEETPKRPTQQRQADRRSANWDDILGPGMSPQDLPSVPGPEPEARAPQRDAPEFRRATQADTLRAAQGFTPTDRMRDLMNRLDQMYSAADDTEDAGYPEPQTPEVPARTVNSQNLPAVAGQTLQAAGVQNPTWHQVANLPGNIRQGIRRLGRQLFGQYTQTPTDEIYVIANFPQSDAYGSRQELNAVAAWARANGQDLGSGTVTIPVVNPMTGQEEDMQFRTHLFDAAGIRWLLVQDEFGTYIYTWPRDDSRAMANPNEPRQLR